MIPGQPRVSYKVYGLCLCGRRILSPASVQSSSRGSRTQQPVIKFQPFRLSDPPTLCQIRTLVTDSGYSHVGLHFTLIWVVPSPWRNYEPGYTTNYKGKVWKIWPSINSQIRSLFFSSFCHTVFSFHERHIHYNLWHAKILEGDRGKEEWTLHYKAITEADSQNIQKEVSIFRIKP